MTAQTADIITSSAKSSLQGYYIGNTIVTVNNGTLSTNTVEIDGKTASLTYSSETRLITAAYDVQSTSASTSSTFKSYTLPVDDSTTATVKINQSTDDIIVSDGTNDIAAQNGTYTIGDHTVTLNVKNNELKSVVNSTNSLAKHKTYTFTIDGQNQQVTVTNDALTDEQKTFTVGAGTVTLDYANNALSVSYTSEGTNTESVTPTLTGTTQTVTLGDVNLILTVGDDNKISSAKYKIGDNAEQDATVNDDGTITIDDKTISATIASGLITSITCTQTPQSAFESSEEYVAVIEGKNVYFNTGVTSTDVTVYDIPYTITNGNGSVTIAEHVVKTFENSTINTFSVNGNDVTVAATVAKYVSQTLASKNKTVSLADALTDGAQITVSYRLQWCQHIHISI